MLLHVTADLYDVISWQRVKAKCRPSAPSQIPQPISCFYFSIVAFVLVGTGSDLETC